MTAIRIHPAQTLADRPISVRLPTDVDRLWRAATSSDPSFFLRWAVASCLLREGWASPEHDVALLPFKSPDTGAFELLTREELAAAIASGQGFVQGW
jgi:hypothetical protein